MSNLPRNKWGDIEINYPNRTIEERRQKLKRLIGPPKPDPEWKRYIKNASDEEINNLYNWLCIVGRIND